MKSVDVVENRKLGEHDGGGEGEDGEGHCGEKQVWFLRSLRRTLLTFLVEPNPELV